MPSSISNPSRFKRTNAQMARVYDAERQSALERWGAHIMELVTGKRPKAEVVDLRGGRG
jgi:hypothetical protein